MRIAQLAPLWETVPPRTYGGTELVVHLLTEALVEQGHTVTLFASGQSKTGANLQAGSDYPLRDLPEHYPQVFRKQSDSVYPGSSIAIYRELLMLEHVAKRCQEFDIIHNHLGFPVLPFAGLLPVPVVTTLHNAFKSGTLQEQMETEFFAQHTRLPFVSISHEQRRFLPDLNYVGTVYHGLDLAQYSPSLTYSDKMYLAFLGRFCDDKGAHIAVQAALKNGWNLVMAGKVDTDEEKAYFAREIEPYLDGRQIRYVGEVNHGQKVELLKHAAATLCPLQWPEPFGLVMIESMACGTPVLALRQGSVPEVVRHGETGFVLNTPDELLDAVRHIGRIDRRLCRYDVEERFSVNRMVADYVKIYEQLVTGNHQSSNQSVPRPSRETGPEITNGNFQSHRMKSFTHFSSGSC